MKFNRNKYTVMPECDWEPHTCYESETYDGTLSEGCAGCEQAAEHPCMWCGYGGCFTTHSPEGHATNGDPNVANFDMCSESWCDYPHLYERQVAYFMYANPIITFEFDHDCNLIGSRANIDWCDSIHRDDMHTEDDGSLVDYDSVEFKRAIYMVNGITLPEVLTVNVPDRWAPPTAGHARSHDWMRRYAPHTAIDPTNNNGQEG